MKFKILVLILIGLNSSLVFPYETDAWKVLFNGKGFNVSFIFYEKANNYSNGVVLKLVNKNDYPIKYKFTLIFRADKIEKEKILKGLLKRNQAKAGSNDGLFFLPFEENISISEVGIKEIKISRIESEPKGKED